MIYVFEDLDNNATVVYDEESLNDSMKEQAIKVEELPIKETPEGKTAVLKANVKAGEVWYEYVDEPIDRADEIEQLKETNSLLTSELAKVKIDIMMMKGGAL